MLYWYIFFLLIQHDYFSFIFILLMDLSMIHMIQKKKKKKWWFRLWIKPGYVTLRRRMQTAKTIVVIMKRTSKTIRITPLVPPLLHVPAETSNEHEIFLSEKHKVYSNAIRTFRTCHSSNLGNEGHSDLPSVQGSKSDQ